jgi:pimeloyl-ACP methyl ester carboxylesterase
MTATLVARPSSAERPLPLPVPRSLRVGMRAASVVAPGLAAWVAYMMFFTPPRIPPRQRELDVLARADTITVGPAERRVMAYTWGDGQAVLLVHGWGGNAGHLAAFVDPLVAVGFRAVAVDLPGHGRSAGRRSSAIHGAAALRLAEEAFGPLTGLVAHSFGAPISTYALARGGLSPKRVVYVAPAARFEPYWARFGAGIGASPAVMARAMRRAEGWLDVRFDDIAPLVLAVGQETPLLILHPAEDRETPITEGRLLADAWPGAELREVAGLGHMRVLWDETVIDEAIRFLTTSG